MKLGDRDEAVLELLGDGPATAADLAAALDLPAEPLDERLGELADNGLLTRRDDGTVERTESGRRVLVASPLGAVDGRIDTTEADERALAALDLAPDEAEAVRSVYAVIRYWGSVTREELEDAVYAEVPAGYDDSGAWWTDCVREPLAALPDVVPPDVPGEPWRYADVPEVERPTEDGRRVLDRSGQLIGSVKDTIESLDLADDERAAVHEAFTFLRRQGAAPERGIAEHVFERRPTGYADPDAVLDGFLREAFEQLPHVERTDDGEWRYRQPPTERDGKPDADDREPGSRQGRRGATDGEGESGCGESEVDGGEDDANGGEGDVVDERRDDVGGPEGSR